MLFFLYMYIYYYFLGNSDSAFYVKNRHEITQKVRAAPDTKRTPLFYTNRFIPKILAVDNQVERVSFMIVNRYIMI